MQILTNFPAKINEKCNFKVNDNRYDPENFCQFANYETLNIEQIMIS